MIGAREPGLQQRAVGREREERQPDRDREQAEQPERRGRVGRRAAPPGGDRERQEQARDRHHDEVDDDRAPAGQISGQRMRIGVAGEQHRLEEHHRDRPHRRRSAEPRQHHLGEHRLHGEQQRGREENRGGEDAQQDGRAGRACWLFCSRVSKRPDVRRSPGASLHTAPQHLRQSRAPDGYPSGRFDATIWAAPERAAGVAASA